MADITKTNHKGLGLPKHFDPSMEQMKKNMEVIDDILQKAVPNDLTSITDANAEPSINALKETGRYLVKSNATGYPVAGYAGVVDVFRAGTYILQEWRSINSPNYVYRRYSTNTGSSWGSWIKDWNANNDGSGSGLDADTLDGLNSTAFFRTGLTQTSNFNSATSEGKYRITGTTNAPYTGCTDWICVVYHLSNTTNELYQIAYEECNNVPTGISGGSTSSYSSMPLIFVRKKINSSSWTSWQCLWHSGNDGANSGMNADMLDGYHASTFMQVSAFEAYMEAHKGYDYVIASQADFDAMIADETWFGAESILFLCDVRASGDTFSQTTITIPDFVKYIEGLHHTISYCSGFGYESVPDSSDITNLKGIRNLKIYNSNASGSQVYGFKNCINLYGCEVSLSSPCPSIICFDNCNNLTNCFGWVQSGSSASYSNVNIKVFNKCSNLTHCTCQNSYANENTAGYYVFYECTNLNDCICYQRENNYGYSVFYKCDYLYGCKISQRYTTSTHTFVVGFEQCTNLTKCSSDTAGTTATYKECNVLIDCEGTDSSVDCEKIFKSSQILHSVDGGTYDNPTIINEQTDLPCIIKDGYSAFVNPETGTVLKSYYPHQPVMVLGFDTEMVDEDGDLFFEHSNPKGSFMVLSGDSTEIQYYKIDTQADTLEITGYFEKLLEKDGTGSKLDADLLDGKHASDFITSNISASGSYNIDSYQTEGFYSFATITSAKTLPMWSVDGNGYGLIVKDARGNGGLTCCHQLLFRDGNSEIYIRNNHSSAWSDWVQVGGTASDILTKLKTVDGSSSGLDADLLDGQHEYQMAKYGDVSGTLPTTGDPTSTSTGGCQMFRFKDSSNLIGEGANRYYGIIQIYYSSSYYTRIAVSMTSGKVYRQTSSQTAWNEITPLIPVVTSDPSSPSEGQMWILNV